MFSYGHILCKGFDLFGLLKNKFTWIIFICALALINRILTKLPTDRLISTRFVIVMLLWTKL